MFYSNARQGRFEAVQTLISHDDTRATTAVGDYNNDGFLDPVSYTHLELPKALHPTMGYLSLTFPEITRGPHEHVNQTDLFLFFSGTFRLYLWDARPDAPTYGNRQVLNVGVDNPMRVIVPPGVVHAYRNIGDQEALVINCPNQLYAGEGKKEAVDEIRHEDINNSPFIID